MNYNNTEMDKEFHFLCPFVACICQFQIIWIFPNEIVLDKSLKDIQKLSKHFAIRMDWRVNLSISISENERKNKLNCKDNLNAF